MSMITVAGQRQIVKYEKGLYLKDRKWLGRKELCRRKIMNLSSNYMRYHQITTCVIIKPKLISK